jgi:membrane-associated phospholipid phosphatase
MVPLEDATREGYLGKLQEASRFVLPGEPMTGLPIPKTTWTRAGKELGVALLAALAYFAVRSLTEGSTEDALRNANRIERFEDWLGILVEPHLQNMITGSTLLVNIVNWIYIWAHWPLIIVVAAWLIRSHPETYHLTRNAFLISGGAGLIVFAAFPVAPPRLTDMDVLDTVTQHSNAYRFLQPPAFTNQYAALPSLHFGWNLIIGIAIYSVATTRWLKAFAVVIPIAMALAVVLTANHYIVDAVAGAVFALAGLWVALKLRARRAAGEPEEREPVAPAAAEPGERTADDEAHERVTADV